jgi:hypothetical protein
VAYRNYHEFARGKPRRTLSSQLSGKLTDSTLSAPCAESAAFWRAGLAELTVAFAKRSLSSRFVETFTAPPLIVYWTRSISAELARKTLFMVSSPPSGAGLIRIGGALGCKDTGRVKLLKN